MQSVRNYDSLAQLPEIFRSELCAFVSPRTFNAGGNLLAQPALDRGLRPLQRYPETFAHVLRRRTQRAMLREH